MSCTFSTEGRLAAECTNQPELSSIIEKGYGSPNPPIREKTILDMIPEDTNPNNTPVMNQSPPLQLQQPPPTYNDVDGQLQVDGSNIIPLSPRAPLSPRIHTSQSNRRQNKLKPRANNPHTTELQPVVGLSTGKYSLCLKPCSQSCVVSQTEVANFSLRFTESLSS